MARRLALVCWLLATLGAHADQWLPVREIGLELAPGSPLDFSVLLPNPALDADHRLVVANGRLAMSDRPDQPVPLLCASLGWSPASGGFPSHDEADRYARQLAMHGYNIARLHNVDASLMFVAARDFDFDLETLDRFHYLLAALKREGISWIFDGLTSHRGGFGGHDDRWDNFGSLKQDLLLGADGFAHWHELQRRILGAPNPYTGLAPIADPALALIVLVNEGALEFDSLLAQDRGGAPYSAQIADGFNAWLRQHYADTAALATAWGGLGGNESLEARTIALPTERFEASPRYRDLQRFFLATETAGTAAMTAALRAMGYQGAVSNYNNWPTVQASLSRRDLDVVTMNTYHDWVSGYQPGARLTQQSAIADGLGYLRVAAGTRWLGKPFLLTEYDHLFWNRYRYEAGLAVPAMAALQGWDGLCRHGHGPIVLRYGEDVPHKRTMLPYAIALDPIARAGETLTALLFRRGDVSPSAQTIPFLVDGDKALGEYMSAREPDELTGLMALGRIGLADLSAATPASVPPDRATTSLAAMLDVLPDPAQAAAARQQHLVSDTGEVSLSPTQKRLQLVTPNTVAAAFETLDAPLQLGPLTLYSSTTPALFALSSLDGEPLEQSRRILVIFATDARNTGMRFADPSEQEILDWGTLPVLIKAGAVEFTLPGEGLWSVAPVGLDGQTHPLLAAGQGVMHLTMSNAPPSGPTTYFIIERD